MNGYEIPKVRCESIRRVVGRLSAAENVVLTTHVNADGDGVGSEAAVLEFLLHAGAEAWIVNPTPIPPHLEFLIGDPDRIIDIGSDEARAKCREADLCVVLDTSEGSRLGKIQPLVTELPTVVIDHHPSGGGIRDDGSLRDTTAAAAGELVFDLIWSAGGPWTPAVVKGLYVAIMTDTGSFRFSNVTSRVHRIVAELIERGAAPDELYRDVYGRIPLRRMHLLGEVLPSLSLSANGRVAWISVPADTFRNLGCTSEDLDGLVDYPRELEDVDVGILFRELEGGQVKVSLRSNGDVDVNALASEFGGGGHLRASGALVGGSLEEVRERVVVQAVALTNRDGSDPMRRTISSEP